MRASRDSFVSIDEDLYSKFLKQEIDRLVSELSRLESLDLKYDYSFSSSGFPVDRGEDVVELAKRLRLSVVKIAPDRITGKGGLGTGFVIGDDLIITNEHVISVGDNEVAVGDERRVFTIYSKAFNAQIIGFDEVWDIALLRTKCGWEVKDLGEHLVIQYLPLVTLIKWVIMPSPQVSSCKRRLQYLYLYVRILKLTKNSKQH